MEAWSVYTAVLADLTALESPQMPDELPCWMTTRKYLPPKDGWSDFVFQHLFSRSTLFLSQTEPPERPVQLDDVDGLERELDVVVCTDSKCDSPELSDEFASLVYNLHACD
ncbi:hypothetical protein BGZ63DRAFT_429144 [Mariannaea sp. PMI_226]|nr:hypothetical protein BGZ63DRAFT_429144 [Mariannaea sp. PMI_226]